MIVLDGKISGNFVEMPLAAFIQLTTQFINVFTPEQAVNVKVLLMQSGDTLHVYTRPNDDEKWSNSK